MVYIPLYPYTPIYHNQVRDAGYQRERESNERFQNEAAALLLVNQEVNLRAKSNLVYAIKLRQG